MTMDLNDEELTCVKKRKDSIIHAIIYYQTHKGALNAMCILFDSTIAIFEVVRNRMCTKSNLFFVLGYR